MALVQTLGVSSLLLTGVGYLAGRYRELRDASHTLVPVLGGVVATLAYAACFAITQFLLGVESTVSPLVIRDALVGARAERAARAARVRGRARAAAADLVEEPAPAPARAARPG